MSDVSAGFSPDRVRCAKVEAWLVGLRDRICAAFEAIEDEYVQHTPAEEPLAASSAPSGSGGRRRRDDLDHARASV